MILFITTFIVLLLCMLALGVGLIMGRKGLTGTCGGMATLKGLVSGCAVCEKPCDNSRRGCQREYR